MLLTGYPQPDFQHVLSHFGTAIFQRLTRVSHFGSAFFQRSTRVSHFGTAIFQRLTRVSHFGSRDLWKMRSLYKKRIESFFLLLLFFFVFGRPTPKGDN
jgi:hypothetical protein